MFVIQTIHFQTIDMAVVIEKIHISYRYLMNRYILPKYCHSNHWCGTYVSTDCLFLSNFHIFKFVPGDYGCHIWILTEKLRDAIWTHRCSIMNLTYSTRYEWVFEYVRWHGLNISTSGSTCFCVCTSLTCWVRCMCILQHVQLDYIGWWCDVRIVQTLGIHKMEIRPWDAIQTSCST